MRHGFKMEIWRPNVLLLGPGGAKGFLMLGSLLFLEKTKLLKDIKKIVGISIGSVIGLFYSIGCSITEIIEIALMTQLSEVMTNLDIINIMKTNGLVSHETFRKRMNDKVVEKYGFVPTLQQLYLMTGYEFEVVVTNLNKDEAEYFSHKTQPNLPCVEAVLMSMSLPLFFQSYVYNDSVYVDGAICDPFPIQRYESENVLGIMLKTTPADPKESFFNYMSCVIHAFTTAKEKIMNIPENCKILNIEYQMNDIIGMKMSFETRVDMVLLGFLRGYQFYDQLYKIDPINYPMTNIQKYVSLDFFSALSFPKQEDFILEHIDEISQIDSEEMEDEADEYLMELFESDSDTSISSDEEEEDEEENEEEQEESEDQEERQDKGKEQRQEQEIQEDTVRDMEQHTDQYVEQEERDTEQYMEQGTAQDMGRDIEQEVVETQYRKEEEINESEYEQEDENKVMISEERGSSKKRESPWRKNTGVWSPRRFLNGNVKWKKTKKKKHKKPEWIGGKNRQ